MKLKTAVWASVIWTVVGCAGAIACLAVVFSGSGSKREKDERAQLLGSGAGLLMAIGYGVVWFPVMARVGKERRERRQAAKEGKRAKGEAAAPSRAKEATPAANGPTVRVRCPACGKTLGVKAGKAGKTVKCPACGKGVAVPAGE